MDGVDVGDLGGADDAAHLQVALAAGAGADADGFVRHVDVHGVHVGFGIHSDSFDIEFFAGADDADGDLTTVGDEDFFKHRAGCRARKTGAEGGGGDEGSGFCDIGRRRSMLRLEFEEWLAVLDGLAIFDKDAGDGAAHLGLDLVHDLHGFDDADGGVFIHGVTDVYQRFFTRP